MILSKYIMILLMIFPHRLERRIILIRKFLPGVSFFHFLPSLPVEFNHVLYVSGYLYTLKRKCEGKIDIGAARKQSKELCAFECMLNAKCAGFVHNKGSGTCTLKSKCNMIESTDTDFYSRPMVNRKYFECD